jgi:hypothetical protein
MQTASWWQKEINTQLASFAELRHDNLLYAKQSYTVELSCSTPDAYIEPIPEFYKTCIDYSNTAMDKYAYIMSLNLYRHGINLSSKISEYLTNLNYSSTLLYNISKKILAKEKLTTTENSFLRSVIYIDYDSMGCVVTKIPDGWYSGLFYNEKNNVYVKDYIIADIHTSPTDADGNIVGWVKHIGTGPINLATIITNNNDGVPSAYIGPVMSYYEYTSLNFDRLTDERWKDFWLGQSSEKFSVLRPPFVDLYMADTAGNSRNLAPVSLPVGVEERQEPNNDTRFDFTAFPNPFETNVFINFSLNSPSVESNVTIEIYDILGNLISQQFSGRLQNGNYALNWAETDSRGSTVPSGYYICKFTINGLTKTVILIKK